MATDPTENSPVLEPEDVFVEQAEYLNHDAFAKWSETHPDERTILSKLKGGGAKLLTGPRGSGKTTLMLKARYELLNSATTAIPVYVNFKASLKLEPLYRKHANASFLFAKWLILKVYEGLFEVFDDLQVLPPQLSVNRLFVRSALVDLEVGRIDNEHDNEVVTHDMLETDVVSALSYLNKSRCVLLLDDAAHAFSPEQQRDFFDFFRRVKSRAMAPKAAIYPGVTIYSPSFHVGHDAEQIDVWIRPESPSYLSFFKGLIRRRLRPEQMRPFDASDTIFSLLCYAAFGMPRSLLNMVRFIVEDEPSVHRQAITRQKALSAIQQTFENACSLYMSLGSKLPMYKKFVETGEQVFQHVLRMVKGYNSNKGNAEQSVIIAVVKPIPSELSTVLSFFQYSGLVLPRGTRSRGDSGVYEEFVIHYAALIERNVLFGKRAINLSEIVSALATRHPHAVTRTSPNSLIGKGDFKALFMLALPACQVCKAPRASEHARFCQNCGAPLREASLFESLVCQDISVLRITALKISRIKEHTSIRTVQDILIDHDHRLLRSVPSIGAVWAQRIYLHAEEHIT